MHHRNAALCGAGGDPQAGPRVDCIDAARAGHGRGRCCGAPKVRQQSGLHASLLPPLLHCVLLLGGAGLRSFPHRASKRVCTEVERVPLAGWLLLLQAGGHARLLARLPLLPAALWRQAQQAQQPRRRALARCLQAAPCPAV